MDVDLPPFIKQDAIIDPGQATNNDGKIMKKDYIIKFPPFPNGIQPENEVYHSLRRFEKRTAQLRGKWVAHDTELKISEEGWHIGQE